MALENTWVDLQDAVEGVAGSGSDILAEHLNLLAHSIIDLEKNGGASGFLTIDDQMSDTSENAVQNRVIKKYVDDITGEICGGGGTWETIADITIPDGFASYSYTITSATYPDMAKITDFYIAMTVPKQSDGAISGALQVQLQPKLVSNYVINIARFGTWNHASYIMKGFVFSKLYGDKRHNQYYGFSANATMDLSNNSLLGGLDVGYFEAVNIALSDTSKTLPVGMTIKIVGCKK